jgi:hypothetical protein
VLGDIAVKSPEGGLVSEYSMYLTTFDSEGQVNGEYCYLDEMIYANYLAEEPGWYTFESVTMYSPVSASDAPVAFGVGMMIQSDCGATVTFAGNVVNEDKSIAINGPADGSFTCTGNASPLIRKLADFAISSDFGLQSEYSVYMTTYDAQGQIEGEYCYLDEMIYANYIADAPGWYTFESVTMYSPESAGNVDIDAGRMFMIQSDCGATITIPSALPAAEE